MYTTRLYQTEPDYALMRQLLMQTFPLTNPPLNCTTGDLDWWRSTTNDPDVMSKVRLWFDDIGTLVAFVWPGKAQVDVMIRPNHRKLERMILSQAEDEFRQTLASDSSERSFSYWSLEQDTVRNMLLTEFGYQRADDYLTLHKLTLERELEPRPLTAGYQVRSFLGESEIEARVDVHRAAFHPSKMTVEKHRNVIASNTYRQELDLVCAAPDGTPAAYTIVWFDEVNRIGIFEPVGCHPDHQRKGLASAVMVEGLRRLYDLGATHAYVNSWREDSAGAYTYKALGFEVIGRIYQWRKDF